MSALVIHLVGKSITKLQRQLYTGKVFQTPMTDKFKWRTPVVSNSTNQRTQWIMTSFTNTG